MKESTFSKPLKFKNLINSHISSHFYSTPLFVRMIPTDKCNLDCKYCWQRDNASSEMTLGQFKEYLNKAFELKVGMISFLGGEPMMWKPIVEAIRECTGKHILTDLTTNGTLLNASSIKELGEAGLDYLNISTDGLKQSEISSKNFLVSNNILPDVKAAKLRYGMHTRINSVIYNNNFNEVKELIEFSKENDIQLSLGFIVPPISGTKRETPQIYFSSDHNALIREIVDYILNKKKNGYPIIDPDSYFENIFHFLSHEKFWECNYPTRFGWINVTPAGKIRSCTKKMDELNFNFLDLNPLVLKELRGILKEKVKLCNIDCYSNCAYDSYFYTTHKFEFLKKVLSRIRMPEIKQ